MYDVDGHGIDATGQTIGFTLWGAGERQAAMDAYHARTGDTQITVDPRARQPATRRRLRAPARPST